MQAKNRRTDHRRFFVIVLPANKKIELQTVKSVALNSGRALSPSSSGYVTKSDKPIYSAHSQSIEEKSFNAQP